MRVLKLKISNVGRFVGDHSIDFSTRPNLIQVDAENHNTGGSSGGGKSTIFNSLEYALGINEIPSTVLQSRLTKDSMAVELLIEQDGKQYTITRNKSEGLKISGIDVQVSGSNKEAEDALDRLVGIPRNLLRPMIHKRQGEGGFFLSMTPKQSHEFLMDCLGMKKLDESSDKIDTQIKIIEKDLLTKKALFEANRAALDAVKGMLSTLVEPTTDVDPRVLEALSGKIKSIATEIATLENELGQKLSQLTQPKFSVTEIDPYLTKRCLEVEASIGAFSKDIEASSSIIYRLNTSIQKLTRDIDSFKREIAHKPRFELELIAIKAEIVEAMKKTCPTCKQDVAAENIMSGIIAKLAEKGQKKKAEIDAVTAMEDILPKMELDLISETQAHRDQSVIHAGIRAKAVDDEKALASIKAQIEAARSSGKEQYHSAIVLYNQARSSVELEYKEKISTLRTQASSYESAYHQGKAKADAYKVAKDNYDRQKAASAQKLESLEMSVSQGEVEVPTLEKNLAIAKDALRLTKSYANQLFQDSLGLVAENASKILSRIPNMNTATISFDAFKETKSGTVKEEVTAVLSLDGEIGIPVKSISGGERAAVDLAVDLAVIDMIESKTGKGLDLFILDEPFDGLDAICRENCLEVLKSHVSSRKIVIVDHSTETKQMVQDKILVIRDGQNSLISDTL